MPNHQPRAISGGIRFGLAALALFVVVAGLATYPVVARLAEFTVLSQYADSMLQAWTLKWDVHALLSGPESARQLWDANMFYPYPHALAFSEHLLSSALLLMPFTLLGRTPLVAHNLGILFTTALAGWGMYLLVTWLSGNRWAGLVAGLFLAIAPFRMGHLVHFHLLSMQWFPFIFLALARLIKYNRNKDLGLLLLFVNLQLFAVINYAVILAVSLAVWGLFFLAAYRWTGSLLARLALFGGVTLALNWPVLQIYRQVSHLHRVVRTLGDARVLAASLSTYLLPMGNSLLYARWLHLPTRLDSAFPGLVVLVLALAGGILAWRRGRRWLVLALLVMTLAGLLLSFGANEQVLGPGLAPVVARLLPYPYLYDLLLPLKGFRVPARFALLPTLALAMLAGLGFAELGRRWWPGGRRSLVAVVLVGLLLLVEHVPAPVPGQAVAYRGPVYSWLADRPPESVVLELPYYLHTDQSFKEMPRVYQAAGHWQRLVNGNSGFEPLGSVALGYTLDTFPDWRSFDLLRQLGVEYVVLHRDQYEPAAWDNLLALLPGYLPAVEAVHAPGEALVLQLAPPRCKPDPAHLYVDATILPTAASRLEIYNGNPAAWVSDPRRSGQVVVDGEKATFLEPLFVLPGRWDEVPLWISVPPELSSWQVTPASLPGPIDPQAQPERRPDPVLPAPAWQPVQIPFANGAILQAMALGESAVICGELKLGLQWKFAPYDGELVRVELVDRFNRLAVEDQVKLAVEDDPMVSSHRLFLAETLPPGRYQLQVRLLAADESDIPAVGPDGAPVAQPVALPVVVHPSPPGSLAQMEGQEARFANDIRLLGASIAPAEQPRQAGDWLRFTLAWQAEQPLQADLTVFAQLLGPDGQVWGQHDNQPRGGWYSTSLWPPGQPVVDDYAFPIREGAPAGSYRLIVGLYDSQTLERLPVQGGGDFVEVGQVQLGP